MSGSIAVTEIRAPHAVCKTEEERQVLRTNLMHYSNKCVAFCDSLDTLNDISMIFLFESFLLASVFYGDQSKCAGHDLFSWAMGQSDIL
jgi:hypothetical protein